MSMMYPEAKQVQKLAYQLWEQEGRPSGRDKDHWMEAERRLAVELRPDAPPKGTNGKPAATPVTVPKRRSRKR